MINQLFLNKSDNIQELLNECIRWKFEILILSDSSEGAPFEAVIVLRGHDTSRYLEAVRQAYEAQNAELGSEDEECYEEPDFFEPWSGLQARPNEL